MKMKNKLSVLVITLALAISFSLSACKSAKKADENGDASSVTTAGADENTTGDSDSGKAMGLQTVQFPYDSFVIDAAGKAVLKANAAILKDKASLKIQVEGHCDERGGIQYNIALGEKRANSVKKFLVDLGTAEDRITTISFGKERPIAQGSTEEAWAKNRRANFVITSK